MEHVPYITEGHNGKQRRYIRQANKLNHQIEWFEEEGFLRTRINLDLENLTGGPIFGGPLTGSDKVRSKKSLTKTEVKERLQDINERLKIYGLVASRLIPDEPVESNDPILMHRADRDPRDCWEPIVPAEFAESPNESLVEDERWASGGQLLKSDLNPVFGQTLHNKQKQASISFFGTIGLSPS